ncbi:helix-turn-helix domain-containing protein [Comamonas resistens]|uniref:Helix-turn-helix transcriptional regulator n=1 Tax=Comamonas resistens TaxID=3046670 RepID=A0ABY8SMI3_9BURK|nr:helix-turn-helix transcriptional regulator [Comamonas resistens]MDL5038818.1 helix-turn-helix transcriptional regulator [Comamonas resistens]WHS64128.1 helix-turn-helix transcriptional regulator [Comamonas resistens]
MPRQNTSPAEFPPAILLQIEQLAQRIVQQRKSRGETQAQWAERLGISQPTMARIERGDAAVSMATYVACLWQLNPALDLTQLLAPAGVPRLAPAAGSMAEEKAKASKRANTITALPAEQQAQVESNFAAAKAALDFFKSPMF